MKSKTDTIRRIVNAINDETSSDGFWLPNIQRPFVWSEDQIERLFDSIMREYPISTLLIWKTKSKIKCRRFIDNYKSTLKLSAFEIPENSSTKLLVLDGQQRLQSLFIGLKGSYERKELCFDVLSGDPVIPEDIRFKFKFMDAKVIRFPKIKFKDIILSPKRYDEIAEAIIEQSEKELSRDEKSKIRANIALAIQQFCNNESIAYQELDSVDSPDTYKVDDIVEIFIRSNSGGTKLGKSDLLFSLLSSTWDEANEQLEDLLDNLNRTGFNFTRDFILKTCITLLDKGARYEVSKFRDEETRKNIIDNWKEITNAIKDVKDFLYGKTFLHSDKAIPSYLALVPVIYFRYHFREKWQTVQRLDTYILRTLIAGAFSGNPDTLIDQCIRNIRENQDFDVNKIFTVISNNGRNLKVSKDTILGERYGSDKIHLIFNLLYKDFNYQPSYTNNLPQIDHIFPQSLLRNVKEDNLATSRKILKYKQQERDQIANCMLLTAEENGAGGKTDTPPDVWFADKSVDYLNCHLIPQDRNLWKLENYDQFIEARQKLIFEKFTYLIQDYEEIDDDLLKILWGDEDIFGDEDT